MNALLPLLNDSRDAPLLACAIRSAVLVPLGVAVYVGWFAHPVAFGVAVAAHLLWYALTIEPFITFFHDVNHRPLFRRRYTGLNRVLNWAVGSAWGTTPHTYYAHHVVMHHPTNNLEDDASTTLPYQRDSITDFIRYYAAFFVCLLPVRAYVARRYPTRPHLARRPVVGELSWWAVFAILLWVAWLPTLLVLGIPLLATRSLLIIGNWGEHAFVDPADPGNPYGNSTELIGHRTNGRAFNVGYHCAHHLRPGAHYSEHPAWFEANIHTYGAHDAVVFRDLNYPEVWLALMRHDYAKLARHFVQLPGAPRRAPEQIEAFLRSRVRPIVAG